MIFKPLADRTRWEGLLACVWLLLFDVLLVVWALRRPIDWIKFLFIFMAVLSLPLLLYWAYRTWAAFTLRYAVERHGVDIRWANERRTIAYGLIDQLVLGGVSEIGRTSSIYWPAPGLRPARALGLETTLMLATAPLDRCLVVRTEQVAYALSPAQMDPFVETVQTRYAAFDAQTQPAPAEPVPIWTQMFGGHRSGPALIAGGLLGVLVLVGVLMVNFPSLPDTLALQYSSEGIPEAIRNKSTLFLLPIIGFLAWFVNGIGGVIMAMRNQPTGAYLLWGGAIVVQICSLLALMSIIP